MTVIVICRRCGVEFAADRTIILSGRWRLCPACRDDPFADALAAAGEWRPVPA